MTLWYATQATVSIGDAWTGVSTTQDLATDFANNASGSSVSAKLKEVTFGGGAAGADVLNVFNTQYKEEKRPELRTCDLTLVFQDISDLEYFGLSTQTESNPSGSYYRWSFVDSTGDRKDKAILIKLTDGTKQINILMNHAYFTTTGEISLAADGTAELTISAGCLVKDFYAEDNI